MEMQTTGNAIYFQFDQNLMTNVKQYNWDENVMWMRYLLSCVIQQIKSKYVSKEKLSK